MQHNESFNNDLLIVGGSYAGLCLAIAIKQYRPSLKFCVIDSRSQSAHLADEKCHAIAPDCVKMLQKLQIWSRIEAKAEPILKMDITDSRLKDIIRPKLLQLTAKELPALAYMIETKDFMPALYQRAAELNIEIIHQCELDNFTVENNYVAVKLANKPLQQTKLLIAADGKHSRLRAAIGIKSFTLNYEKKAIVCTVKHEWPHNGVAIQHFLPAGPFAILPLSRQRSSLVWTENTQDAQQLLSSDSQIFIQALEQRFGRYLGKLSLDSKIQAFPLDLILPHSLIKPRFMLIGDAAHAIHPLCGQGLNLGLRDCATAAQIIVKNARLGLDIGMSTQLEAYQTARRLELVRMGFGSHFLHQLFSNDYIMIRQLRDIGLYLVNRSEKLKNYFIAQATGQSTMSPALLQGKDI